MKKWLIGFIILISIVIIVLLSVSRKPYVVLVSMDAFRWDYDQLYNTPNLDNVASVGVKTESLIPVYPTSTFPNHYSIATGLYPDHHGLISNTFWEPEMEMLYRVSDRSMVENGDFYYGDPIWNTVERNGIKSASMYWVGSEAPINGKQPTYWSSYDGSLPYSSRVDSVIHWLSLPKKVRPRFVTLYFDEPDGTSHTFGPNSPETDSVVTYLDGIIGDLMHRINDLPISKSVNVIIVSDHGMGEISNDRVIRIRDHVPDDLIEHYTGGGPYMFVDPVDNYKDSVLTILNSIPMVRAWSEDSMPEHYHYGKSHRFPGIIAESDSSWMMTTTDREDYYMSGKGTHGWDPLNTDMQGIFFADGPAFKDGFVAPKMENVDVYNIICRILKIEPSENDGDLNRIASLFK